MAIDVAFSEEEALNYTFPKHLQERFENAIIERKYSKGETISCEQLAEHFQVSHTDMAQVLSASHRKGLVRPCADAFQIIGVIDPIFDSLFQHTSRSGMKPTSDVRSIVVEPASATVAERLLMPIGAPVYHMERTRNVNGVFVANQANYVPYEVCPGLEDNDLSHYSFQKLLEEKYHMVFSDLKESISLVTATEQDRVILSLPEGAKVLIVERLSISITDCPVVWADIHIRTDRYPYVASLWPAAARLLGEPGAS
jgi:GntR family transcriptional regulator